MPKITEASFGSKNYKYLSQAPKNVRYQKAKDFLNIKYSQSKLPRLDKSKYQSRRGLEGPFMTKAGQVVYYDKIKGDYYNPDTDMYIDYDDWKKLSEEVSNRKYTVVHADKGKVVVDAKSSYEAAIKAAAKWGLKSTSGVDAHLMEEAPANATGTAVAGTGDDSSTVVVKKKKKLQDKLMRRLKIKESLDKAVPDLEYPKDEITERKQQLIDLAKKYGENI